MTSVKKILEANEKCPVCGFDILNHEDYTIISRHKDGDYSSGKPIKILHTKCLPVWFQDLVTDGVER